MLHGSVRPAALLVAQGALKLTDFGLARLADSGPGDAGAHSKGGQRRRSSACVADALSDPVAAGAAYTDRSDVYGAGVVLSRLLGGDTASSPLAARGKVEVAILAAMLDSNPARRPAAAACVEALLPVLPRAAGCGLRWLG